MATNEPLKPCPFCGSTHIQVTKCTQEFRAWVELDCRCGASAKALPEPGIFVATYEDAVAVWNRRSAAIPTVEGLKRYDWQVVGVGVFAQPKMLERKNGEFVLYADHVAALASSTGAQAEGGMV